MVASQSAAGTNNTYAIASASTAAVISPTSHRVLCGQKAQRVHSGQPAQRVHMCKNLGLTGLSPPERRGQARSRGEYGGPRAEHQLCSDVRGGPDLGLKASSRAVGGNVL